MRRKAVLAAALDLVIAILAYALILVFRFQESWPEGMRLRSWAILSFLLAAGLLHLGFNVVFRVYSIVNRYVGLAQATWIVQAGVVSACVLILLDLVWPDGGRRVMPLSVVLVGGGVACTAMIAVRFYGRVFHTLSLASLRQGRRVLIVGAGAAADMLIRQIDQTPGFGIRVVGLVDDDPKLSGMRMHRYPILGKVSDAPALVDEHQVEEVFIAIPSAGAQELERIHRLLKPTRLLIKTVPPLAELIDGQVTMQDVRELQIEDLLGREPVDIDLGAVGSYLQDRRVLVTGAAGSIGSELCRQIAGFEPESLIMVDRNESGLYDLHEELRVRGFSRYCLVPTHIQQRLKMRAVFAEYRPHVVFHAAAFKHVPLMEAYPDEAVLNNVRGTLIVAEEAGAAGVERFVNISTDKAADPISAMGASKAAAELVVREMGRRYPHTCFCSVRFGNVLGSRGSVIPIFRRQIAIGGPVTVTHRDMTRYFMSISEAVQLVLQAASMASDPRHRGAVFILDMGSPVRILDLAERMIAFAQNGGSSRPVGIVFTGLRPGERMHELLVGSQEQAGPTSHPLITVIQPAEERAQPAEEPAQGAPRAEPDGGPHPGTRPGPGREASRRPSHEPSGPAELEAGRGPSDEKHDDDRFVRQLENLMVLGRSHADRATVIEALRRLVPAYRPLMEDPGAFGGNGNDSPTDQPAGELSRVESLEGSAGRAG